MKIHLNVKHYIIVVQRVGVYLRKQILGTFQVEFWEKLYKQLMEFNILRILASVIFYWYFATWDSVKQTQFQSM